MLNLKGAHNAIKINTKNRMMSPHTAYGYAKTMGCLANHRHAGGGLTANHRHFSAAWLKAGDVKVSVFWTVAFQAIFQAEGDHPQQPLLDLKNYDSSSFVWCRYTDNRLFCFVTMYAFDRQTDRQMSTARARLLTYTVVRCALTNASLC